jgi:signal transduction histidine kinase
MSLVKAIIEAHDGEIQLDSRLGEGTRVSFALPLATDPASRESG